MSLLSGRATTVQQVSVFDNNVYLIICDKLCCIFEIGKNWLNTYTHIKLTRTHITHPHLHTNRHTHLHTHPYTYANTHTHTCMQTHIHTQTHAYIHTDACRQKDILFDHILYMHLHYFLLFLICPY